MLVKAAADSHFGKSFPLLFKVVNFLADASAKSFKLAARSAVLVNAARRAVWLKAWMGDATSKLKLCGLPFSGDHLFETGLQEALERTKDKKNGVPSKEEEGRGQTRQEKDCCPKKALDRVQGVRKRRNLFQPFSDRHKAPMTPLSVGGRLGDFIPQ